jgi:hypothetical protein
MHGQQNINKTIGVLREYYVGWLLTGLVRNCSYSPNRVAAK